jgi:hypothetical protein
MRSMVRVRLSPSVLVTGACSWIIFRLTLEWAGENMKIFISLLW